MPVSGVFLNVFGDGDHAAEADVRDGTTYNNGNLNGTLVVGGGGGTFPADTDVIEGVVYGPNDNDFTGRWHKAEVSSVLDTHSYGVDGNSLTGTYDPGAGGVVPNANDVRSGVAVGVTTGNLVLPNVANVRTGINFDSPAVQQTGTLVVPDPGNVRDGITYDAPEVIKVGVLDLPAIADVRLAVAYDNNSKTGTLDIAAEANLPSVNDVLDTAPAYGPNSDIIGVYHGPLQNEVWNLAVFGPNSSITGTNRLPAEENVLVGVAYGPDDTLAGTYTPADPVDYPASQNVRDGVVYNNGNSTGDMVIPDVGDVRDSVVYDTPIAPKTGTLDVEAEAKLPPTTRVI